MTAKLEDHEVLAWLGDGWTDAQAEQIIARWRAVEHLADDHDTREQLLTAIAQDVDGTAEDLVMLARRAADAAARLRAATIVAVHGGMTEVEAAAKSGVSRVTVRRWLGK